MLGDKQGLWDELVGLMAFPKLRTSHYNENGKNIFYSKITIIFSILMVISMSVLMIRFAWPLIENKVQTTKFERSFLSNSIGYTGNKTLTQDNSNSLILQKFFDQKSTNFHSVEFNLTEFIGYIESISEFSVTTDLMERTSIQLFGPNKPDNENYGTDFVEMAFTS